MELAVHAATFGARDLAIQRAAGGDARRGIALYVFADREAVQRRLPDHVSGASGDGDLCWVQQRSAESSDRTWNSPFAKLRHQHRERLHQRQPAVFREGELSVPILRGAVSYSQLSAWKTPDSMGLADS